MVSPSGMTLNQTTRPVTACHTGLASTDTSLQMRTDLAKLLGSEQVLDHHDERWLTDATVGMGLRGRADAIVAPRDAEEVAAVVAWCYGRDVAIVPRGGGTGFAGGA